MLNTDFSWLFYNNTDELDLMELRILCYEILTWQKIISLFSALSKNVESETYIM